MQTINYCFMGDIAVEDFGIKSCPQIIFSCLWIIKLLSWIIKSCESIIISYAGNFYFDCYAGNFISIAKIIIPWAGTN